MLALLRKNIQPVLGIWIISTLIVNVLVVALVTPGHNSQIDRIDSLIELVAEEVFDIANYDTDSMQLPGSSKKKLSDNLTQLKCINCIAQTWSISLPATFVGFPVPTMAMTDGYHLAPHQPPEV